MTMTKRDLTLIMQIVKDQIGPAVDTAITNKVNGKIDNMKAELSNYMRQDTEWKQQDKEWKEDAGQKLTYVSTLKIRINTILITVIAAGGFAAFLAELPSILSLIKH